MLKYVVFDFDGTLADTYSEMKRIAEEELDLSEDDFDRIRKDGLREMIRNSDMSVCKFYSIAFKIKSKLNGITGIKLFLGIREVLCKLKSEYGLGIVSSNSEENIGRVLSEHELCGTFDFIHSDSSFFGKHKVLKRMCRKLKVKPEEVIYIGDEDRDVIASRKNGIKCIAVTWGFNSEENLKKESPDFLARKPSDILANISHQK